MLNLLVYDVEFPDGDVKHYAPNVIAENVLSQVDSSGLYTQALDDIFLHSKLGNTVSINYDCVTIKRVLQDKADHYRLGVYNLVERRFDLLDVSEGF